MNPEKKHLLKIARSFGSASESYDISARLQRYSGKNLMPWLPNRNDLTVVDLGSGTGFFTEILATRYHQVIGLDISSQMLSFAKQNRNNAISWLEADAYKLPFADSSLDGILRIYAPCKAEELARVINENGVVITVTPAGRHLYQLRERIYQEVRLHNEDPEQINGFALEHQEKLSYIMELADGDAFDLLQMTPFAWKASDSLREELTDSALFKCEADFMLRVYRKI